MKVGSVNTNYKVNSRFLVFFSFLVLHKREVLRAYRIKRFDLVLLKNHDITKLEVIPYELFLPFTELHSTTFNFLSLRFDSKC